MLKFKSTIEAFRKNFALIFDLDGTLVDTSQSFDETVVYLVKKFSGVEIELGELYALRREGGFNDDWVSSQELLRRRGIQIDMTDIARSGEEYYLSIAEDREELLIEESLLGKLNFRNQIFIVTGRKRREYAPVWGSRLDLIFNQVYCSDDAPGFAPKPAPDYLLKLMADYGIENGAYVGNSVDDMQAARAAGLYAIGIASGDNVSALNDAGAQIVLSSCNQLAQLFMVP